jgi:uncharacterized protein
VATRSDAGWRSRLRLFSLAGRALVGSYLGLVLLGFFAQRSLMYPAPKAASVPPSTRGRLIVLEGASPRRVHVYHVPAPPGSPTVAIFYGNAEQLVWQVSLAEEFADAGLGAYVVEYPGYGLSSDSRTTEENVYADAQAALRYLATNLDVAPGELVLFGRSLGTGVAAEMARRGFGCRLILVSPYSSMVAMAARTTPFLPTTWLVLDRYDTLAKAPAIRQPTFVVHGAADTLVPPGMARAVAQRLPLARFRPVPDAGHNDVLFVGGRELWGEVVAFARTGR